MRGNRNEAHKPTGSQGLQDTGRHAEARILCGEEVEAVKYLHVQMDPVPVCPLCGRLMCRDKVTRLMRKELRWKCWDGGTVTAWRGMFCRHRVAVVTAAYRLLNQDHWQEVRP